MAYTTFPSYAQFLLDGYAMSVGGGVARDEMDDGYTQQSPTQSRTLVSVPLTYRLSSQADHEAFEQWRREDLRNGSLFFAWRDPRDRTGATQRRARIVKGEVQYKPLSRRLDEWSATFQLEYYA
ncbi:hypothetical protein [Variovorax sp.]|uniref:hypothetical protein n=1 Tax=Variovorax sp. TaxID=1871043 RepID=UPI003BAD98ED